MTSFSFYRPEFLWGLLFLGAVLLIHLLRRPPLRSLDFSTLRFFHTQAVKTSRMRRLRKLLLLLSRLSAAAALVMLFAQPFNKHNPLSLLRNPHLTVFTWIDPTPSMEYSEEQVSLLTKARSLADSLRSALPSSVRHFRYDEAKSGFLLCDPAKPPLVRARHGPPRLDRVLRAWNESRQGCSLPLLVLLSDFQKPTSECLDTLLPPQMPARIMCVTLTPRSPWNYSVRDALLHDAGKVSAVVAAQGRSLDSGEITVAMSGIRTGRKLVSLPSNDTAVVDVAAAGLQSMLDAAGGSVALNARDPLTFDNTAFFVSQNRSALRVIVVGDRERNFPVVLAFAASGKDRWNPVTSKECNEVTFDDLDSADVVVISAMNRPSRPLETFFTSGSSVKKTVLLAVGADNEGFGSSAAIISKVNLSSIPLRLETLSTPATIVLPDTISETWQGFPTLRAREAAIYRYGNGLPGTVLLRLDNGTPLVTHVSDNQGRSCIFIATPLGVTDANNLCETGFYVPFIDRIVHYAASVNRVPPDAWIAGMERRNPFYSSGKGATVLDEVGKFLERWQAQPSVLFKQPGLYKIVPDAENAYWISAIADPAESKLIYRLPVIPESAKNNILILNDKQLLAALEGRGSFLSYLPWLFLVLLLLAEIVLWENPMGDEVKK